LYLGQRVLIKYEGKIVEGNVSQIFSEDLEIKLENNIKVFRKFWEIRKKDYE